MPVQQGQQREMARPVQTERDYRPPPPPPPMPVPVQGVVGPAAPIAVQGPAVAANAGQPAAAVEPAAGPPAEQSQATVGESASDWYHKLKSGRMDLQPPQAMVLNEEQTVNVVIHGDATAAAQAEKDSATSTGLRVSDWMEVELSWPDNVGDFEIVSAPESKQFVERDLDTTWTWTLRPLRTGTMTLQAKAYVVYPGTKGAKEIPMELLESAKIAVPVRVETLGDRWHDLYDGFERDPLKWLHYYLPGGGGFVILTALVAWWKKWFGAKEKVRERWEEGVRMTGSGRCALCAALRPSAERYRLFMATFDSLRRVSRALPFWA